MAIPAYMSVKGATQGAISSKAFTAESVGNAFQEGHADEVYVVAAQCHVSKPTDPQTGQPSGLRRHQPFIITKQFDKASPLIWQALCTGELLQIELKFYRTSTKGGAEHYYTIGLTDAVAVDMKAIMYNSQDSTYAAFGHLEEVSFVYRAIKWAHEISSTQGQDDWRTAVS